MKTVKKIERVLSLVLCIAMLLSSVAFAESEELFTEDEIVLEEVIAEEIPDEEIIAEEIPDEEVIAEEIPGKEVIAEEIPDEEIIAEEIPDEEIIAEEPLPEEEPEDELALLAVSASVAAVVSADGETLYDSLAAAEAAVKADEIVKLLADVNEHDIVISNVNHTIDLGGFTVDAQSQGRVFKKVNGATVTITNGTIQNGKNTSEKHTFYRANDGKEGLAFEGVGGGIYTEGGKLIVNGVKITGCEAKRAGGGICAFDCNLTLNGGTEICNCSATKSISSSTGSEFADKSHGGGVFFIDKKASPRKFYMDGASIHDNEARLGGGISIETFGDKCEIRRGSIYDNKAYTNGGGILFNYSFSELGSGKYAYGYLPMTLWNVAIYDNDAKGGGGGGIQFCPHANVSLPQGNVAIFDNKATCAGEDLLARKTESISRNAGVTEYMLGAGLNHWVFGTGSAKAGQPVPLNEMTATVEVNFKNNVTSEADKQNAIAAADVKIYGNKAATSLSGESSSYYSSGKATKLAGGGGMYSNNEFIFKSNKNVTVSDLNVRKQWLNSNGEAVTKPEGLTGIRVELCKDNEKTGMFVDLNASNNWTYTFHVIHTEGEVLSVIEEAISGEETAFAEYTLVSQGTDKNGDIVLINQKNLGKGGFIVGKTVTGMEAPNESFEFEIALATASGAPVGGLFSGVQFDASTGKATISLANGQSKTISGIAEGTVVTVTETSQLDGFTTTVNGTAAASASKTIVKDSTESFRFVNDYKATTSFTFTKVWNDGNDQDRLRDSYKVALFVGEDKIADTEITRSERQTTYTWRNLPKYDGETLIEYRVDETSVPEGYTKSVDGNVITNTHVPKETEVTVNKIWNDGGNQDGTRASYKVALFADNKMVEGSEVTLEATQTSYTWEKLPFYRAGLEITYTVKETGVPAEYVSSTADANAEVVDGVATITNSYTPKTTSVTVTKLWDDGGDQDGVRAKTIVIRLKADGTEVRTKELTAADAESKNKWTWTFEGLPMYSAGSLITYTITEDAVKDYTSEVKGFTVTNSYTPGKVNVFVNKVWNDNDNYDGLRPASITVELIADDVATGKFLVLSEDNKWTGNFMDLDECKAGKKIAYTVSEVSVPGYFTEVSGDAAVGFTITNTEQCGAMDPIVGLKLFDGQRIQISGTYNFILRDEDTGEDLQTVHNNPNAFEYEAILYTAKDIGTHVYTIREEANVGHVENDKTVYTITVTVGESNTKTLPVTCVMTKDGEIVDEILFNNHVVPVATKEPEVTDAPATEEKTDDDEEIKDEVIDETTGEVKEEVLSESVEIVEEMPEEEVPLAEAPVTTGDEELEELPEDPVPLADVPATGESWGWAFAALACAMLLAVLNIFRKKETE